MWFNSGLNCLLKEKKLTFKKYETEATELADKKYNKERKSAVSGIIACESLVAADGNHPKINDINTNSKRVEKETNRLLRG